MDTKQLERFAQSARRQLHEEVAARLDRVLTTDSGDLRAKEKTIRELKEQVAASSRQAVVEKVAYTWFNRFCALRYMDVNHYTRLGTVSPAPGFTQPEILQEAKQGVIDERFRRTVDAQTVSGLLSGRLPSGDPQQEAYRLLLVGVCNAYHDAMPFMFEEINDYTELLMPDDLLSGSSILQAVREALTAEKCADVEVIGWLYQFYISEKKDEVMGRKGKVPSEDIPAVTQLFTPHWIVRYMVENSLGRLWMLNHPDSRLVERMDYYIKPETSEVSETSEVLRLTSPEEIRLCDPAAGSGHILTYAFDLLYAIYEEEGYNPVNIPRLILEKNLTGIEIDPRAGALAGFALMMKARERDARFFNRNGGWVVQPDICVMEDVTFAPQELDAYMEAVGRDLFTQDVQDWLRQFEQATTFGSLIRPLVTDTALIRERLDKAGVFQDLFLSHTHERVRAVLRMTEALQPHYHVIAANPPYMSSRKGMSKRLKKYLQNHYTDGKSDLFSAFMIRILEMIKTGGFSGLMTPVSWMFLSSFEQLRVRILDTNTLVSLVRPEYHAFFDSAYVSICSFILCSPANKDYPGVFFELGDFYGADTQPVKLLEAINNTECSWRYQATTSDFQKIPGTPIAFWLHDTLRDAFSLNSPLSETVTPRQGLATGHNARFLREWHEVSINRIGFGMSDTAEAHTSGKRWFPCNKGGEYRKWYGNNRIVIAFDKENYEALSNMGNHLPSRQFYFQEGITWSTITSNKLSMRYSPPGAVFETKGSMCFAKERALLFYALGFTNTKLVDKLLMALSPTIDYHEGPLGRLPLQVNRVEEVVSLVKSLVRIAQDDWNSSEISYDFHKALLLNSDKQNSAICDVYWVIRNHWQKMTQLMENLEKDVNQIFIDLYGMQELLESKIMKGDVTLNGNPHYRYGSSRLKKRNWAALCEQFPETCQRLAEISAEMAPDMPEEERLGLEQRLLDDTMREFISYAVGCMFGRYSLDKPGLFLANQGETLDDYLRQVPEPTFMPDEDNVIPMLDGDWFPDDVSERFKRFLRVTFGEEHYEENLAFIELTLNQDVRGYFLRNFYKDHLKRYSKRPIYWLFSSPKGSFNALVYMHRYRPDTVSVVLNDYLREFRTKLTAHRRHLEHVERSAEATKRDKTKAVKEIEKIDMILKELREYEDQVLYPLATQQVEIDLDDGVKVNYNKFGRALAHVRSLSNR